VSSCQSCSLLEKQLEEAVNQNAPLGKKLEEIINQNSETVLDFVKENTKLKEELALIRGNLKDAKTLIDLQSEMIAKYIDKIEGK